MRGWNGESEREEKERKKERDGKKTECTRKTRVDRLSAAFAREMCWREKPSIRAWSSERWHSLFKTLWLLSLLAFSWSIPRNCRIYDTFRKMCESIFKNLGKLIWTLHYGKKHWRVAILIHAQWASSREAQSRGTILFARDYSPMHRRLSLRVRVIVGNTHINPCRRSSSFTLRRRNIYLVTRSSSDDK